MKHLSAAVAACLSTAALLAGCEQKKEEAPPEPVDLAAAERCFQDRAYQCAAKGYYNYLRVYPRDPDVNAKLAIARTRLGRHREALPHYKRAIELGVTTYDLHANNAVSLEATGDLEGAIAQNREALKIVPTLVDVRGNLASQLERTGKVDEALKLLQDFDRDLARKGHPPYFGPQIEAIKARQAAKPAG